VGSERRQDIVSLVEDMVGSILARRNDGLALDRVEYRRESGQWFLRVFLDHPLGVTVDHCTEVARELGDALDRTDPIPHSYNLEVSSPGAERPLTRDADFERFKGRDVTLHFYRAVDGKKKVTGRLKGLTPGGDILLEVPAAGEVTYTRSLVSQAHLAVDWSGAAARGEDNGGGDG